MFGLGVTCFGENDGPRLALWIRDVALLAEAIENFPVVAFPRPPRFSFSVSKTGQEQQRKNVFVDLIRIVFHG